MTVQRQRIVFIGAAIIVRMRGARTVVTTVRIAVLAVQRLAGAHVVVEAKLDDILAELIGGLVGGELDIGFVGVPCSGGGGDESVRIVSVCKCGFLLLLLPAAPAASSHLLDKHPAAEAENAGVSGRFRAATSTTTEVDLGQWLPLGVAAHRAGCWRRFAAAGDLLGALWYLGVLLVWCERSMRRRRTLITSSLLYSSCGSVV